jgi:hypothetical protein
MFALTFLGTSASVPSAERNHPGLLIGAATDTAAPTVPRKNETTATIAGKRLSGGKGIVRVLSSLTKHGPGQIPRAPQNASGRPWVAAPLSALNRGFNSKPFAPLLH